MLNYWIKHVTHKRQRERIQRISFVLSFRLPLHLWSLKYFIKLPPFFCTFKTKPFFDAIFDRWKLNKHFLRFWNRIDSKKYNMKKGSRWSKSEIRLIHYAEMPIFIYSNAESTLRYFVGHKSRRYIVMRIDRAHGK